MNFTKKRIGWNYPATLTRIRRGQYELTMRINEGGELVPYIMLEEYPHTYARITRPPSGHRQTWDVDFIGCDGEYKRGQVVRGSIIGAAEWAHFVLRDMHGVPVSPYEGRTHG